MTFWNGDFSDGQVCDFLAMATVDIAVDIA